MSYRLLDLRDDKTKDTATCVEIALRKLNYIGNYLSIGDSIGSQAILNVPYIRDNKKHIHAYGINIQEEACGQWEHMGIDLMNAHHMSIDNSYIDVVLCCMMLEHDPEFWKTLSEVRRVLRPGGIFLLAVPVYTVNAACNEELYGTDKTICYRVHGKDYYRFSLDSISEVLMKGFVDIHMYAYGDPPRVLCYGTKENSNA